MERLITRYLAGKASVEETNQVDQWYQSFETQNDLLMPGASSGSREMVKKFIELKVRLGLLVKQRLARDIDQ